MHNQPMPRSSSATISLSLPPSPYPPLCYTYICKVCLLVYISELNVSLTHLSVGSG